MRFTWLRDRPRLATVDDLFDDTLRDAVASLLDDDARLAALNVEAKADPTGRSVNVPRDAHPTIDAWVAKVEALVGMGSRHPYVRLRRYLPGDAHPPHLDTYDDGRGTLIVTALAVLVAPTSGGSTTFPAAEPPITVDAVAGRTILWFGHRAGGDVDPASLHQGDAVIAGEKLTCTLFLYQDPARASDPVPSPRWPPRTLHVIADTVPKETVAALQRAAQDRGLGFRRLDSRKVPPGPPPLPPGDLLYTAATQPRARALEVELLGPGVGTLYRTEAAALRDPVDADLLLARRGVPAPRTVRLRTNSRDAVRAAIEAVGGLPAIFKVMGGEGGVGVARVDSWPSAYSVADLATSRASTVFVREFVPDALHWRLVVVADRVVAAYPNPTKDDDFRSRAPTDADDYRREPPPAAVEVAVRAVATLDVDLGGVDVLVTQDGRALVLEVNFPCFFAQAEIRAGVDVGGPIVDALLRSSKPG